MALNNLPNLVDMLQCSVCMEEFEASGSMRPKMLPCQHSFCVECLSSIANALRIECPLCRKICHNRIDDLPNNLILLQLIDSASPKTPKPVQPTAAPRAGKVTEDPIVTIRKCMKEPGKLHSALKAYLQGLKPATFKSENLLVVLQCLEQYVQSPRQQADIVIDCTKILEDMIKFSGSMSSNSKQQLHKNIMHVVMASNIRSAIQAPCIHILYSLVNDDFQKSYNCANTEVLFGFLDDPLPAQAKYKLIIVLWYCIQVLRRTEKEDMGSRHNIKNLLDLMTNNWRIDQYVGVILSTLISLTDLTSMPCTNVIVEGGLDILQRILTEQVHGEETLKNAILLVNNLSEVPDVKSNIIKQKILMEAILNYLQSKDASTSVLSAKTITNLSLVSSSEWLQLCGTSDTRRAALAKLHKQVLVWIKKDPGKLQFQDNSFRPSFPILQMYGAPPCQLYAAWWIRKCCNDDKERCQELLIKEDGLSILLEIKENDYADKTLRKVVSEILASITIN